MSVTLPHSLLKRHINQVFVETGTYDGGGVQVAIDVGFEKIHSIEIDLEKFKACRNRFKENPKVSVYWGDTLKVLPILLSSIQCKATLWIDAHAWDAEDKNECYSERYPLSGELKILSETIGRHDHTLLIDDRLLYPQWGLTEDIVLAAVKKINPDYQIEFQSSKEHPRQILEAVIR